MAVLVVAVQQGLLGQPDMQISGNGSLDHTLRWFADRSAAELPRAALISVPLLVYREQIRTQLGALACASLGDAPAEPDVVPCPEVDFSAPATAATAAKWQ